MTNLHTISSTVNHASQMELPIFQEAKCVNTSYNAVCRWTYLIANNVQFTEKQSHAIRLPKPDQKTLLNWIEKIIRSNQCSTIFVEQLVTDEISFQRIKQLCFEYKVHLVNLPIQQDDIELNVVKGPW